MEGSVVDFDLARSLFMATDIMRRGERGSGMMMVR